MEYFGEKVMIVSEGNFYHEMDGFVVREYPLAVEVEFDFGNEKTHRVIFYKKQVSVIGGKYGVH